MATLIERDGDTPPLTASEETWTTRVGRLHARLQASMLRHQKEWRPSSVAAEPSAESIPLVLRRAHAVARTLVEVPIEIADDELIVGKTSVDGVIYLTSLSAYATDGETARAKAEGFKMSGELAHKTPDYPSLLTKGLRGILDEMDAKEKEIAKRASSDDAEQKLLFMRSMRVECEAAIDFAHRFADLAESQSVDAEPTRAAELREIAPRLRRVPEHPAQTFEDAVQSVWLMHLAFFSTGTHLSLGRLDQYCWPYLERDLATGSITVDEVQEVLDCLWLKFNERGQLEPENYLSSVSQSTMPAGDRIRIICQEDNADSVNHFGQNVVLAGVRPDGADGTNDLTYMCLDLPERFQFTSPVVSVRLHAGSPARLVRRCAEIIKQGGAMPAIFNDDAIVPAYAKMGVPIEDARDYVDSNCWETMIAGKSDQELIRGINFLLMLEWTLNRGVTRNSEVADSGVDTGDPRGFASFDDLLDAWKRQMDAHLKANVDNVGTEYYRCGIAHSGHGRYSYNPLLSALTQDCISRETDVIRGGARYVIWHLMAEAVPNCIDAMAAIKKLVYDDRAVSLETVLGALASDWRGCDRLRQRMIAEGPKFANDNAYADEIGRELMSFFVERSRHHAQRYPSILFTPTAGTFSWYTSIGREIGASCDGRHAGDPVTSNFSPSVGADLLGPTAAVKSYCKMSMADLPGGGPIDLRMSGSALSGEDGTDRLASLIRSFVLLGGNMMTVTVTDVELLKRAMKEPEKYRSLRVRMGGWSAYFVTLSPEQQRLHIARLEH